jgi:hypothetical protein
MYLKTEYTSCAEMRKECDHRRNDF